MLIRGARRTQERNPAPRVAFRTPVQKHSMACPFQLGSHGSAVSFAEAFLAETTLLPGDVVVVGSDGLFDNLWDTEIAATVALALDPLIPATTAAAALVNPLAYVPPPALVEDYPELDPEDVAFERVMDSDATVVAGRLVAAAAERTMERSASTPFSVEASEEYDAVYNGGKRDDITAVVVCVNEHIPGQCYSKKN